MRRLGSYPSRSGTHRVSDRTCIGAASRDSGSGDHAAHCRPQWSGTVAVCILLVRVSGAQLQRYLGIGRSVAGVPSAAVTRLRRAEQSPPGRSQRLPRAWCAQATHQRGSQRASQPQRQWTCARTPNSARRRGAMATPSQAMYLRCGPGRRA